MNASSTDEHVNFSVDAELSVREQKKIEAQHHKSMTTNQNTIVREECTNDHDRVEFMTREAFWNVYAPGATEHYIVHKLRDSSSFVKELSLIACQKDTIVGHVMYSKAKVVETGGKEHEVLCMGPLTVDPAYQKNGIGSLLIKESTKRARALGYKGVIIFGNPQYYHRFGYVSADTYGITTSGGQNFDPFMVLELLTGGQ